SAKLTPRWSLTGALTLLEARIVEVVEASSTISPSLTTGRVDNQPEWKISLDTDYTLPVGASEVAFRAGVTGTGDRGGTTSNTNFSPILSDYFLVNASIAYRRGPIELAL